MKFKNESWNLKKIISIQESGQLHLNPPYQRGDIWTSSAKRNLIDSIKLGYPLPTFFIYQKPDKTFEMVDGQQRTRAIIGYHLNMFTDNNKTSIDQTDKKFFYEEYEIPVTLIFNVKDSSIEDFYYRVNKFGTKLNRAEIQRAQYFETPQLKLVSKISSSESFIKLGLFTETSLNRLNDEDVIAELLTLELFGISDKKNKIDDGFLGNENFNEDEARDLEEKFNNVLTHLERFNEIYPIKKTRYKQRNDIYTLYSFLNKYPQLGTDALDYFYKLLVVIDENISPSNIDCYPLKEYAENCVSQSNSKKARLARLMFLEEFLLNTDPHPLEKEETDSTLNLTIYDILKYYGQQSSDLVKIKDYWVLDFKLIQQFNNKTYF